MLINFRRLDKEVCKKHLRALLNIHSDVSAWTDQNLLLDLPGKWELSIVGYYVEPICYAILSTKWNDRVHIHHFMVHRDYRGRGIGAKLLTQAKERAFTCRGLLSLNVMKTNHRAIMFYKRHGFGLDKDEEQQVWLVLRM